MARLKISLPRLYVQIIWCRITRVGSNMHSRNGSVCHSENYIRGLRYMIPFPTQKAQPSTEAIEYPPFRLHKEGEVRVWAKSPPTHSRLSSGRSRPRSSRRCATCAWTSCTACWSVLPLCELCLLGTALGKLGRWARTPNAFPPV